MEEQDDDDDTPPSGGGSVEKTVSATDPDSGMFVKGEHKRCFAYEAHTACNENGFVLELYRQRSRNQESPVFLHGECQNLYVVQGARFQEIAESAGTHGILNGIQMQGGVMMFGHFLPIWVIILIEFCFTYLLENLLGSLLSFRLVRRIFNPQKDHPMLFETAIICATVSIMCPSMNFLAAWMYYPYSEGFHILTLLANWGKLVCFNFPFAYFSQLFFIQPTVRTLFKNRLQKQMTMDPKKEPSL